MLRVAHVVLLVGTSLVFAPARALAIPAQTAESVCAVLDGCDLIDPESGDTGLCSGSVSTGEVTCVGAMTPEQACAARLEAAPDALAALYVSCISSLQHDCATLSRCCFGHCIGPTCAPAQTGCERAAACDTGTGEGAEAEAMILECTLLAGVSFYYDEEQAQALTACLDQADCDSIGDCFEWIRRNKHYEPFQVTVGLAPLPQECLSLDVGADGGSTLDDDQGARSDCSMSGMGKRPVSPVLAIAGVFLVAIVARRRMPS